MTREEQIIETAKEYYNPKSSGTPYSFQMRVGFITGAIWADETMLENVCEFFEPRLTAFIGREDAEELITAFRKAMEGGEE